ncbi:hypothetical protein F66182_2944 [Fusarium sp. NRRL 66182]|nr:hypothetical protein F66182_2944 [Fusarium sp. NRRL 66182]
MSFGDKSKKHWIIPQECLSPDDLVLGSILKYPNDPVDILNRKEVEPVDSSAVINEREHVTKSFTDALDVGLGSKLGASSVLAAVIGAAPFVEGNWTKGTSYSIEATRVRSQRFIPSDTYMNKALRTKEVTAFVRQSFFSAPIYMVVGVAIANTISRTTATSRGRGAGAGIGIGPPGIGVEVSAELSANRETQSSYHDSIEDGDVVLAYRLRGFQYSKRKDEFKSNKTDETKHARYSLDEDSESGDEEDEDGYIANFSYFEGDDVAASADMVEFTQPGDDDDDSDT